MFALEDIKQQASGGRGITLQDLEPKEKLLSALPIDPRGVRVVGTLGGKERVLPLNANVLAPYLGKRARKGKTLEARMKVTELRVPEA